jgi:multidrug efflux pump
MNLPGIFIKRPVATTLLTIGLILAGIVAFKLLPVSPLPQVDFPTIGVSAGLPGADPETMATSVAAPLERQFGRIAGVTEMTSTSTRGATSITLQFDLNRDINGAARDVQAAINAARSQLPPMPNNPGYRKVNPADAPVLILALTSDTVSREKMYDAASTILQQKLSQVDGVGQVFVGGGALPAVRVELNPTALSHYGISLEDVRGALQATNANRPKGQLADAATAWEIETNDQLRKAAEYDQVVVAYRNGAAVRLPDVGEVRDSVEDVRTLGLVDAKPAIMVIVFRQPGANIIETVDNVIRLMPRLEAQLPQGTKFTVVMDRTPPIRASLHDVEMSLIISCILVVLVVFFFLRSARATIIPGVALVASLVGTFGIMYLFGYSLNNLSLMALTIATGFVVDDAIVVLENITRHMEKGATPFQAAMTGAKEISFTVISMSISLVAVFLPLLLMGGMVGRLFREFAVTLSAAILTSLVLSLTSTPMLCAALLKPAHEEKHGRFHRATGRFFAALHSGYERGLRAALTHKRLMLILTIATLGLNILLWFKIPMGLFPQQDTGRLGGAIQAAQNISFQAMSQKLRQVVEIIKNDPDVEHVVGFTGGGGGSTTNVARMFIALKPFGQRATTADQVIGRLRGKLAQVPGAPTFLQVAQELRVGGRMSNALYQYTLQGETFQEVNLWGPRLLAKMRSLPQLTDVNSDQQNSGLETSLVIDRPTAARLGITPKLIDSTLADAFGQSQVAITYTLLNQYHVVMEVAPQYWQSPESLKDIYLPSASGGMVPLAAIARYESAAASLAVNHQGQFPAVTISFNLAPGVALGQATEAIESAKNDIHLPQSIHGTFMGTAQVFKDFLVSGLLLVLAALVAVYIVLGMLYESTIHPITILSTLPSAGMGAILALILLKIDLSVIAVIGIILLIGLVKKNGIMMVDFALEAERREGKKPEEAILQACLQRFRPIMMTTMAALLGALPLALATGSGSELRRPLGVSIIGGLIVSQMLTLFTTPVVYLYLERFRLWLARTRYGWLLVLVIVLGITLGVSLGFFLKRKLL